MQKLWTAFLNSKREGEGRSFTFLFRISEVEFEEINKSGCWTHFLLYRVDAVRVSHHLNEPTSRPSCQNLIRLDPHADPLGLPNLLNLVNNLHCELFLPYIVVRLHDHLDQLPTLQVPVG